MKPYKLIILIICFALTSIFIYRNPSSVAVKKKVALRQVLSDIQGWRSSGFTELDPKIIKTLKMDDYANQNYSNGNNTISLYIGYYLTTKKVGAAHDPLVCFPGQGWVVSDRKRGKIVLNPKPGDSISYSSMMVHRGSEKELIIYWFQSYDRANPDTFSQKMASLYQRIFHHREDNAFVRVSTPVGDNSLAECREAILQFVSAFYPVFLDYIKDQGA